MRIAVTGQHGQVVCSLVERGRSRGHLIVPLGRPAFDLLRPADIRDALATSAPDVIVSAAAYTAVDKAEDDRDTAFAINEGGARAVAEAAATLDVPLIHLSTDFVFDGMKADAYVEHDPTAPLGIYGASKLAGEHAVLASHADSVILRTAWIYSPFGTNFMKTMLRLAGDRDEIGVVADQFGNPTGALDIADGVLRIAERLVDDEADDLRGVFHMTAKGGASWADFAEAILTSSARHGGPDARVRRIATSDYPTPARRPANSRLDCGKLDSAYGIRLADWRQAIDALIIRHLS